VFSAWAVTGLAAADLRFHWRSTHVINYHGLGRWVGIMTCPLIAWAPDTSAKSVSVRLPLVTIRPDSGWPAPTGRAWLRAGAGQPGPRVPGSHPPVRAP
jgi:hypothetical protein